MARIFISYRHDDAAAWAGRLYDRLADHFGDGQVFMDISDIPLGLDFRQVIEGEVGSCAVLIALIGKQWLTITGEDGRRRLDDPDRLRAARSCGGTSAWDSSDTGPRGQSPHAIRRRATGTSKTTSLSQWLAVNPREVSR